MATKNMNFKVNIIPNADQTYSLGTADKRWLINGADSGFNIDKVYPIGAIYMSVSPTNPSTLFGGTWEAIENTFLVAQGSSFTAGDTGGTTEHSHTTNEGTSGGTAITVAQMPSHNHNSRQLSGQFVHRRIDASSSQIWLPGGDAVTSNGIITRTTGSGTGYHKGTWGSSGTYDVFTINATHTHDAQGSGQQHTHKQNSVGTDSKSNLPPYLAVYMWKRIE